MVKIRLSRRGAKGHAFYRIIATDQRKSTKGRSLEQLGTYDPNVKPEAVKLDVEKLDAWVRKGAQLSPTVKSLVRRMKRHASAGAA
jgi:small subunit ribosomal protein S16